MVSANEPDSVTAHIYGGNGRPEHIRLVRRSGYQYAAMLPARLVRKGVLYCYITIAEKGAAHTYPAGLAGSPMDWGFYQDSPYQSKIVSQSAVVALFDAATDADQFSRPYIRGAVWCRPAKPGKNCG